VCFILVIICVHVVRTVLFAPNGTKAKALSAVRNDACARA